MKTQHFRLFLTILVALGLAAVTLAAASAAQGTHASAAVPPPPADPVIGAAQRNAEHLAELRSQTGWTSPHPPVALSANPSYSVQQLDSSLADEEMALRVNYGHDWVEGNYEVGHTVWLTLTNSTGQVKATASGVTSVIPWWGGGSGFVTNYNMTWSTSNQPDIQVGDWVYGKIDNGKSNSVRVGEIEGQVDVANDKVTFQVHAPWFTETLNGDCGIWVDGGPGQGFQIEPDGGSHTCDFSGEWDILPGQDIGVSYHEPDGDMVLNVFRDAAPHLWVNIWGNNAAAEGSNYVLTIDYNNDGDAPAENVTISQTLQSGMVYLGDTSGVTPTGSGTPGDPLVWNLGDLPADRNAGRSIEVFVQVTAAEGETLAAAVQIQTTTPYFQGDTDNLRRTWEGTVVANQTQVNIGKYAWTWDPVPGSEFVYTVNTCNNGSTASGEVIVTDTLPLSTTLVSWWGQDSGWQEMASTAQQLVVSRPSLSGFRCNEVYIQVLLDENAWQGMELRNDATVFVANDLSGEDNETSVWHSAGSPHKNIGVYKNWISGQFMPGGEIYYEFSYFNNGNVPVNDVVITQTLPAGVTFQNAYTYGPNGRQPMVPFLVTPEYILWKEPVLLNGYWKNIGVVVRINPETNPGASPASSVEITSLPLEDRYDDNQIQWVERVNDFGPNLRVDKSNYQWELNGADQYELRYEIRILNLGNEVLDSVWIEDSYPVETDFNGDWWMNHGPWITMTHDTDNNLVRFWVERLNPGETASLNVKFRVKPEYAGEEGLVFTNTLDAPWVGDVFPGDNHQEVIAYSGPDVFIRKELTGGIPKPGEIITFTVEFGNRNQWPWDGDNNFNSHITETLPAGMTFITSTAPWNPQERWIPVSETENQIVWEFGPMWSNGFWTFDISAKIDPDILGDQILTNQIEAYGDSPDDVEYDWDNNHFDLPVDVLGTPSLELTPLAQDGEAKPGKPVAYTFSVKNTGDLEDSFTLSVDSDWSAVLSETTSGPLMPGASAQFTLTVTIPATAQKDDQDVATVKAASDYDPEVSAQASATTTSLKPDFFAYLPTIRKP